MQISIVFVRKSCFDTVFDNKLTFYKDTKVDSVK